MYIQQTHIENLLISCVHDTVVGVGESMEKKTDEVHVPIELKA